MNGRSLDARVGIGCIGVQLGADEIAEAYATPAALTQEGLGTRHRPDAASERCPEFVDRLGILASALNDCRNDRKRVLDTVFEFTHQRCLSPRLAGGKH